MSKATLDRHCGQSRVTVRAVPGSRPPSGMLSSMTGPVNDPMMFLDVDGTLIPLRARPEDLRPGQQAAGRTGPAGNHAVVGAADGDSGNPLLGRLDPADGRRLLALGCRLVWATTWMADANELIAPRLGLPDLPVVDFPDDDGPGGGLHWKTVALTRWAGGQTFVWLDDEITAADQRWVRAHYAGRALLHRVDPMAGVTEADFTAIRRWLATVRRK
jgi:hypothetical protein